MDKSNTIKLQAHIAHLGISSRRKAEEMILEGKIIVNGEKAHIGQRINPKTDKITIDGKRVGGTNETFVYFLINKPVGYVSTTSDEMGRKTVMDLVPTQKERLYPVGRLDIDSQGLMLLTNDGELTHLFTHPSFEIEKTYHVLVEGAPSNKALNHLQKGVRLKDGYTKPALVKILKHEMGDTWLEIAIHEGRNRQIRRMTDRVGYKTLRLIRVSMGPFKLDDLGKQKFIQLDNQYISKLKKI